MSRMIGWICYAAVMAWPGAWPSCALASWMLAWAGDYANTPPNAGIQPTRTAQRFGVALE